ncbi:hypothetical protein RY831_30155 [Noviherbaspirillum sp. CPCC 100848]|uniref:Uncharacterized protein n=1 Tax=Noviherbaspirillum album TaxID=3080276 RepID=A0ABU6JI92_9BURK|nr:hypothetical protein [Noviherbaspirillum sp. CPCC 100848]MEC4723410.1 hypothetical protein [Noviherbaspirillum sp. CPCC 100848]
MTEAETLLLEPFLFDVDADALADRYFYRYCVPVAAYQELVTVQLEAGTITKKKESAHEYEPVKACIDGLAAVVVRFTKVGSGICAKLFQACLCQALRCSARKQLPSNMPFGVPEAG